MPGTLVELYDLDTSYAENIYGTPSGGAVYHWTSGTLEGQIVTFGGVAYQPMPIEGSDWAWSGQGILPTPKLRISNIGGLAAALVIAYPDLLGAKVTRTRTYYDFLDGQPNADPTAIFEQDIYSIDRKSNHTKSYIEFELAAAMDQQGQKLPKRVAVRDGCDLTYRVYIGNRFYPGTCPYSGAAMFNASDQATSNPQQDQCSHRLNGCVARYGKNTPLPFGGFPGVGLGTS